MRGVFSTALVVAVALVVVGCGAGPDARPATKAATGLQAKARRDYGALALSFIPNAGQADARAHFVAQGGGYGFFFTERGVMLTLARQRTQGLALELGFVGANAHPRIVASERAAAAVSYLGATNAAGLATYGELTYRDVWPGIDVSFKGESGRLKYEFHVAPGADPSDIALAYRGAQTA